MSEPLPLLDLPSPALSGVCSALGLHDALQLSYTCKALQDAAATATQRRYACAGCKHPIFDPRVVFNSRAHAEAPSLPLQDGQSWAAAAEDLEGAVLSEPHRSEDVYLRCILLCKLNQQEAGEAGYEVRVQSVHCGNPHCRLFLGQRIVQLGKHKLDECNGEGLVLHATLLGRCWLVRRYLTLVKHDGSEDRERMEGPAYTCAGAHSRVVKPGGCGNVLFEKRALLSKQHCWNVGNGVERAWYINTFLRGAVAERNEREEVLCQGLMRVADVYCAKCASPIGWRFTADLEGHDNVCQVGRYGIVRSAVQ